MIRLCAWCPRSAFMTRLFRLLRLRVSHTICPRCEATMNAQIEAALQAQREAR